MEGYPDLLTIDEVARKLRVDPTTMRRWIRDGTLEAIELPGSEKRKKYRVLWRTLNDLLGVPDLGRK
jgi:excisionase family DNA binding protein